MNKLVCLGCDLDMPATDDADYGRWSVHTCVGCGKKVLQEVEPEARPYVKDHSHK